MDLRGKKLLVLTGCNGANDIIEYARKMGVYTIATDYYEVSPIKDMADVRYNVSTTDIDALYKIATKHNIDGITTGTSEASMYSILKLAKRMGLPFYATSEQLETINNKKKFKDLLKRFDVPVIKDYSFTGNMAKTELERIEYPVVIKPVDSSGAKGISVCQNEEELIQAYSYALNHSRAKQVVVEKYLKGLPEVFFNYTIVNGEFSLSCAFDIDRYKNNEQGNFVGLPIAYFFPSEKLQLFVDTVHLKVISALKYLGIKNGTMSIQCFVDSNSFYVYEAGYRLGGAQMYIFTQALTGINVMEMMVNYALTGKMTDTPDVLVNDNPFFVKPCCQLNIPLRPGIITVLEGITEIKKIEGVLNITEVRKKGDLIRADGSIGQLCLRIHIIADSVEDLAQIIDRINSNLTILDENDNDMLLHRYSLKI